MRFLKSTDTAVTFTQLVSANKQTAVLWYETVFFSRKFMFAHFIPNEAANSSARLQQHQLNDYHNDLECIIQIYFFHFHIAMLIRSLFN